MKIAYIILAHKNPDQLSRLINRLHTANSSFFVHIDKKVDILPFKRVLQKGQTDKIYFVEREDGRWGRLGIVKGTIHALKAIKDSQVKFDYIVLLSGMDYPLKSNTFIDRYFEQNYGRNFVTYTLLQEPSNWMPRLQYYHFNFLGKYFSYPSTSKSLKRKLMDIMLLLPLRFPSKREFPTYLQP